VDVNARIVQIFTLLLLAFGARAAFARQGGGVATESGEGGAIDLAGALDEVANMVIGARLSDAGLDALKQREGLVLVEYLDTAGKRTIGYGHLCAPWESWPAGITAGEAAELLRGDVSTAESAVAAAVAVPLEQDQFDALVSFVFNVGAGAFKNSTLLRLLNAGDYDGARAQMARWIYVTRDGAKQYDNGLANRRASEQNQFS
jgi:lysozyme